MRALPLDPASPVTYYHVSVPLVRLGDDVASERFLVRATRRFPDNVRLETALSILDLQRGRDTAAMERARRMVARDPENQEGVAYLGELAVVTRAPGCRSTRQATRRNGAGHAAAVSLRDVPDTLRLDTR